MDLGFRNEPAITQKQMEMRIPALLKFDRPEVGQPLPKSSSEAVTHAIPTPTELSPGMRRLFPRTADREQPETLNRELATRPSDAGIVVRFALSTDLTRPPSAGYLC
jgi:hypothetical protein